MMLRPLGKTPLRQARLPAVTALALVLTSAPIAVAANPALEARLARLERMLNERSLSDLVLQIQQLQQEVQDLRGQVETQQYLLRRQGIAGPDLSSSPGFSSGSTSTLREGFGPGSAGSEPSSTLGRINTRLPSGVADPFAPAAATDSGLPASASRTQDLPAESVSPAASGGMLALPAPETSAGGERDLYRDAFELLKARDYPAAREAFGEMVGRYPQGQFADNGRYWLGEIGYVTQDYSAAQTQFNRLVTDYPLSPKVAAAMLKLGYVYYEQDQLAEARRTLEEVVQRFPDTTEARLAQGRLDRMQREGG
jgi:tol-pal system protein YbgF